MPSSVGSFWVLAGMGLLLAGVPAMSAEKDSAPAPSQRDTLRAFAHPYSWAAFMLTGIPR